MDAKSKCGVHEAIALLPTPSKLLPPPPLYSQKTHVEKT